MEEIKAAGVKFVSLQFTDLLGGVKEVIIPVSGLTDAFTFGVWFDGSSIEGFARIQESDLFLKPDLSTYRIIPWLTMEQKTARFICDIYSSDGKPAPFDPRAVLRKVITEAARLGFQYNVGPEPEFYLFKREENALRPVDYGSYFELSSDEGYRLIDEIVTALEDFGIQIEAVHHEVGQGQYEIDFTKGEALEIADKLLTLKYTVKKIAQRHNLFATFMPKPIMGKPGSGLHIHQSLFCLASGQNLFYDESDKYHLSRLAYNFIAGQIRHIKAMSAILSPLVNSYKRLVSGFEAPVYITWGSMNRSALIRVPQWFKPESARIELRSPDPTSNPYLTFAVMLAAGLEGIKNNYSPPEPTEENVYQFDEESRRERNIDLLPTSLSEALRAMKESPLLKEVLGDYLFEKYIDIKTREWQEFKLQVTTWEIEKYLTAY